jgi:hypothetical protein
MEPRIEGSRTDSDSDDTNFVQTIGEDSIRCFVVEALPELDVHATDGEGDSEGEDIGVVEWA